MKAYLKVKISPGMFPHENAVWMEDYTGTGTSGFFGKRFIKDGRLEVEVLEEREETIWVRLPGSTLEVPGDKGYITVRKEDLKYLTPDQISFIESLEEASETVESWPEWKRNILG